ncbi:MAG: hypothetical protein ABIT96_03460 [Ferruginibacter sp.]
MTNIKNNTLYLWLIGILFIANIAMLAFFLLHKKPEGHSGREDRQNMIAKFLHDDINFTDAQVADYRMLSNRHMEKMKNMFDSLGNTKDQQFKNLAANDFSDSIMAEQANASGHNQERIELQMFQHLKNIRAICTPAQLPAFDSLFVKVLKRNKQDGKKRK